LRDRYVKPVVDCGCAGVVDASVCEVADVVLRFGATVVWAVCAAVARLVVRVDVVVIDVVGAVVNAIVVDVVVNSVVVDIAEIIVCGKKIT